jgi:hypothetical protein
MSETVTLHAEDLWSKWGFFDGDIFTTFDWADEMTFMAWSEVLHSDFDPLIDAVRTYLVPAIEAAGHSVELVEIATHHNPIRAVGYLTGEAEPDWAYEISVDVTLEQIRALMPQETGDE